MTDDPIVYLTTVPNEPLARMWADVLEEAGIKTMVKTAGPGLADFAVALLDHELYVLRSQHSEAEAIIRGLDEE